MAGMDTGGIIAGLITIITGGSLVGLWAQWMKWKSQKVATEGTVIERLNAENTSLSKKLDEAEREREMYYRKFIRWRDQAYDYRGQLRNADIKPKDDETLHNEESK